MFWALYVLEATDWGVTLVSVNVTDLYPDIQRIFVGSRVIPEYC